MKPTAPEVHKRTFFSARMIVVSVFLLVMFFAFFPHLHLAEAEPAVSIAPGDSYNKTWKQVDSLVDNGLYKSANELAGLILEKARKEKNDGQLVKALMCCFRMENEYEEGSSTRTIYEMEAEAKKAKFPLSAVLHSMLGEMYWNYYTQNRWDISERTQTVNFQNDSIDTWDVSTLVSHAALNYKLSLEKSDSLKKLPVALFDVVIEEGSAARELRPTLYDFLVNRTIGFFSGEEPDVTQPADHFSITQPEFFASAKEFVKQKIQPASDDSFAFRAFALDYYQQWIAFHLNDADPSALIDADRLRLEFIKDSYDGNSKDSLYENALQNLAAQFPENKYAANVFFELARYRDQLGDNYVPYENETNRWEHKAALAICEKTIAKYPGTDGGENCGMLKRSILAKSISITMEDAVIPQQPFPALLSSRNADSIYFRISKITQEPTQCESDDSCQMQFYLHLTPAQTWSIKMPLDNDYQTHNAQIKIPAVESGSYVLLVSSAKNFPLDSKTEKIVYKRLEVSSISYLKSSTADGGTEYMFLNRANGKPLKGAKVSRYIKQYDYNTKKGVDQVQDRFVADANGMIKIPDTKKFKQSYYLKVEWKKDKLTTENVYNYWYDNINADTAKTEKQTTFFTDRAIYRPGQTVFFKGILLEKREKHSRILPNVKTTVEFQDANGQSVISKDFETNEYGSIGGSFVIPNNGVTGYMKISNESGEISFSVEEYKRPQFNITFNQVKEEIRLGDKVEVAATAKTFSGAPLDHATVKFTVKRTSDYYYRGWGHSDAELANGTITTNDTGGFVIPFTATADQNNSVNDFLGYSFLISVDVTDISGETHSEQKWLRVRKQSLYISSSVGDQYYKENHDSIWVYTKNVDDYDITTDVDFKIYKVQQPTYPQRVRKWNRPDKFIYTKEEWSKWFPEDIYDNEDDQSTWKRQEMVLEKKFKSSKDAHFAMEGQSKWASGTYEYEGIAHDKSGNEIKTTGYFRLSGEEETKMPFPDAIVTYEYNNVHQPGETAVIHVGSAFKDVSVFCEMEQDKKVFSRKWISLSGAMKEVKIPIDEKMRGDFYVHFFFAHNNRIYSSDQYVSVPIDNGNLDITFETFRDKLIPGQEEEWKLKVKGAKGEKVMAEMMAGMYDASLDEFASQDWWFNPWNSYSDEKYWSTSISEIGNSREYYNHQLDALNYLNYITPSYDYLDWFGYFGGWYGDYYYGNYENGERPDYRSYAANDSLKTVDDRMVRMEDSVSVDFRGNTFKSQATYSYAFSSGNAVGSGAMRAAGKSAGLGYMGGRYDVTVTDANGASSYMWDAEGKEGEKNLIPLKDVKARKNLNETVFFYPQLQTDSTGAVIIKFTMGEALTKWKFMALAHTKDLKYGSAQKMVVTQKDLMIMPNAPRFLREGDKITFTAKVVNLSGDDLSGNAQLQLFDAITMAPIDAQFSNTKSKVPFAAAKGQSAGVSWDLQIPSGINAIVYKVVASAGNFSDGEENSLPVLSNRMLVTETLPISVKSGQTKNFKFDKLISQNNGSKTLVNKKLTLEFTSNPAWYAVQSLPYMMEYPYECAEQTFNRFYANTIAANVANSNPKIRAVFDTWKNEPADAFLSNLEKNQDLKNAVLAETPWVLEGKDESDQKRRVGLLFDMNHMADETGRASAKLHLMQAQDGGWPWFEGMPTDRYITQYVVAGCGHLSHLQVKNMCEDENDSTMIAKAIGYMDRSMHVEYDYIMKYQKSTSVSLNHLNYIDIQYLYARSFFKNVTMNPKDTMAFNYFIGQAKKYWNQTSPYMEGMIALALSRYNDQKTPNAILKSLKETAIHNEELGMYWKNNSGGWYWYEAPVETQSLLIEAFKEIANDQQSVDDMRIWLLKNKQANQWNTTKSTADACYALLLDGTTWLATESDVKITLGAQVIDSKTMNAQAEAGTGYFKTSWTGSDISPDMGNVTVTKSGAGISWGSVYWQYFEDLDKITPAKTPLQVSKKLFLQKTTGAGIVLEPVTATTTLHPGDKLTVRVELRSDRDMEYVHMKDMRASGFEPVNVFSTYKYQDGLGYYESTKDASTDFFFSSLPKGVHVFEYPLTVIHAGDFSEGITQVQCMYAPEFSAHSEGVRVSVGK